MGNILCTHIAHTYACNRIFMKLVSVKRHTRIVPRSRLYHLLVPYYTSLKIRQTKKKCITLFIKNELYTCESMI